MRRDFEFWESLWKEESERDDAERGDRHELNDIHVGQHGSLPENRLIDVAECFVCSLSFLHGECGNN